MLIVYDPSTTALGIQVGMGIDARDRDEEEREKRRVGLAAETRASLHAVAARVALLAIWADKDVRRLDDETFHGWKGEMS